MNPEAIRSIDSDVEAWVIGECLLDSFAVVESCARLTLEHFAQERFRLCFEGIRSLVDDKRAVDFISLGERMATLGTLGKAGGIAFLGDCAKATGSVANVSEHCRILEDRFIRRKVRASIRDLAGESTSDIDARELVQRVQSRLASLISGSTGPKAIAEIVEEVWREYSAEVRDTVTIPTGFADFDAFVGGFNRKDLVIVAARVSVGKTTWCLNVAANMIRTGRRVLMFSLEMPARSIGMRLLSAESRVPFKFLMSGSRGDEEQSRILEKMEALTKSHLFVDDSSSITMMEIRARTHRLKAEHGSIDMIIVDYLQLVRGGRKYDSREREVAEISMELKSIAKEFDTTVVAISQLSRNAGHREDKKPQLADLRDSGCLEADADMVVFVHRDSYAGAGGDGADGIAELLIRKNRNGPCGVVSVYFTGDIMRFDDAGRW